MYERRRNIVTRPDGRPVNVARFRGQLFVCATGCCCGRTEDGFAAVPDRALSRRVGAPAPAQRRAPDHRRLPRSLRARQRRAAPLRRPGPVVPLDRLRGAGARALRPHRARCSTADALSACRRPRWPRITSRRRRGSRDRTASPWTTSGLGARAAPRGSLARRMPLAAVPTRRRHAKRTTRPRRAARAAGEPRRGGGAAPERRARLRRAVAGPRLRHGGRALGAGPAAVGGVPPGADRARSPPPRRGAASFATTTPGSPPFERVLAARGVVTPDELEETTFQFEFGERDEVY